MNRIKKLLVACVIVFMVGGTANSVSAATNTQAQQQALMVQQIVNQQVALFQAAGQVLTPEQLALIQQNANVIVTQQLAALQAQQQQALMLQQQQAAALQAQQLATQQVPKTVSFAVPSQVAIGGTSNYVLNKNTKKFHYPTCSSVGDMSPKNRIDVSMSRNEIISQGFVPCKRCNP